MFVHDDEQNSALLRNALEPRRPETGKTSPPQIYTAFISSHKNSIFVSPPLSSPPTLLLETHVTCVQHNKTTDWLPEQEFKLTVWRLHLHEQQGPAAHCVKASKVSDTRRLPTCPKLQYFSIFSLITCMLSMLTYSQPDLDNTSYKSQRFAQIIPIQHSKILVCLTGTRILQ